MPTTSSSKSEARRLRRRTPEGSVAACRALLPRDLPRGTRTMEQVVLLEREAARELPGEEREIRAVERDALEPGACDDSVLVFAEDLLHRLRIGRDA